MITDMTLSMNAHPARNVQYSQFASLGKPFPDLEPPLWFDAEADVLLVNVFKASWDGVRFCQVVEDMLDGCARGSGALVRNMAVRIASNCRIGDLVQRSFSRRSVVDYTIWQYYVPAIRGVESVTLLIPEYAEVVTFTLAQGHELGSAAWAFALDTESQDFEEEMGVYCE